MPRRLIIAVALLPVILAAAPVAQACTSFCMDTPDGPVFGFNLDPFIPGDGLVFVNRRGVAKEGYGEGTTGEVARWTSAYGSVTFNLAGRELPCTGTNEAGLVVAGMELRAGRYPERDARPLLGNANWVQYATVVSREVEHVALASFDFSCGEPPVMPDVNAPVAGEIADDFGPYDRAANRALFVTTCARFGIEVTPETTADLMDLFEGFSCAL